MIRGGVGRSGWGGGARAEARGSEGRDVTWRGGEIRATSRTLPRSNLHPVGSRGAFPISTPDGPGWSRACDLVRSDASFERGFHVDAPRHSRQPGEPRSSGVRRPPAGGSSRDSNLREDGLGRFWDRLASRGHVLKCEGDGLSDIRQGIIDRLALAVAPRQRRQSTKYPPSGWGMSTTGNDRSMPQV